MKVQFTTNEFVRSHGKQPKGFGAWLFGIVDDSTGKQVDMLEAKGTLTEAKKKVAEKVKAEWAEELAIGRLSVSVLP